MKKGVIIFFALGLIYACGGEQAETSDTNEVEVSTDTLTTDSIVAEVVSFETIEDYSAIVDRADLYDKFDASALKDGESWYAEGTVKFEHTVLTNPENNHVVKYVWDEENPDKLGSIEFVYFVYNEDFEMQGTQKIESSTGIYTGMPLKDLAAWNGAPFKFSGFGWDYAGGISAEEGSKIAASEFGMRLDVDYDDYQDSDYDALIGDVQFSTDSREVDGAPIFLGTITYWPED